MVKYSIRKATTSDIEELIRLRIAVLTECGNIDSKEHLEELSTSLHSYFNLAIPEEQFISWVAEYQGNLVACSGICFYTAPPAYKNLSGKTAHIMNMYTTPEHRGHGLAGTLLDKIIGEAGLRGCDKVWLTASTMGRPIYEKYGFEYQDRDMVYYIK